MQANLEPLTREDIQRLESMYVILHEIEQGLWVMAHATKEYKAYQKAHGKAAAEAMLSQTVHDQLFNHDEQYNVGINLGYKCNGGKGFACDRFIWWNQEQRVGMTHYEYMLKQATESDKETMDIQ